MEDTDNTPVVRINGALMANYLQSKAIIVGYVTKVDPDGKRATLRTTDDQFIQVVFQQALNFTLQPNQLVEACGTVTTRNQFQCSSFSHFMPDVSEKFNNQTYNKFINYYLTHINRVNVTQPVSDDDPVLSAVSNDFEIDWNLAKDKKSGSNGSDELSDINSWN